MMKRPLLLIILLCTVAISFAAVPEGRLFHLERSTNRNYICYDVNQQQGVLDEDEPINAYWIRAEEGGVKKELSFLQKKLAFGYKVVKHGNNEAYVHLTAYNKLLIRVCKKNGKWVALCTMNGKEMRLTKMFVQLKPDSWKVIYVDIIGTDTTTGKSVKNRINN